MGDPVRSADPPRSHDARRRAERTGPPELESLARGGALNLGGAVANAAFAFVLVVVVTRGLGATSAGLFFESIALFQIVASTAQWGADVGVVRMLPRYSVLERTADLTAVVRSALVPVAAVGAIAGAVVWAYAEPLGRLLTNGRHGADLEPIVRVLAPFVPIYAVYAVALGATRGFGTMVPTNVVDKLLRAGGQPVLVLAALLAGGGALAAGVAWAVPFAVGLALAGGWLGVLLRRAGGDSRRPLAATRDVLAEFWRFTAPRGLASLFAVTILWLDTLLIGALRSSAEAGVYAAATRYLTFGQFIGVAIAQVTAPRLSRLLASRDRAGAGATYATSTAWTIALAWPLYLTMVVFGPALTAVFGARYLAAAPALAILGGAMLVATLVGPVDVVLLMAGRSSWNLFNTVVAVVLNVVLNLLLIPPFGLVGAACAWAASILANNLLPLTQVWRKVGLHPFGSGTAAAAASATIAFGVVGGAARLFLGGGIAGLGAAALVAGLVYLGLLWRFRDALALSALRGILPGGRRELGTEGT